MQKFDKFINELNTETYLSAADIADERGENILGDDLRDHAEDMEQKYICQDCGDELIDGTCVNCSDEEDSWVDNPALDDVPFDEEPLIDEFAYERLKSFDNFTNESYDDVLNGDMEQIGASDVPTGPNATDTPESSYGQDIIEDETDSVEDEIVASIGEEEPIDGFAYEGLKSFDSFSVNEEEEFFDEMFGQGEIERKCKDCGCDCAPEEEYCPECESNHVEDLGEEPNDDGLGDDIELSNIHQFESIKTFDKFKKKKL